MPELPEVETIKRSLAANEGARISKIEIIRPDIIRIREFEPEAVHERTIDSFKRRGKYLIMSLTEGDYNILVHLGMSGRFYILENHEQGTEKHIHFIIQLDNGRKIVFQDPRRFGGIWLLRDPDTITGKLGKEPLNRDFCAAYLNSIINNRRVAIKTLILDQKLIAGIGNIYADEALFMAGIRPDRAAGSLSPEEALRLSRAIKRVLRQGIEKRGTTFRDYRDGNNEPGRFQEQLQAYGREGEKCTRCGELIIRAAIGGRSSHYCESCQN